MLTRTSLNPKTLDDWLTLLERRHPRAIDLGLERVAKVAAQLGVAETQARVVTVAGTNGKGSCIAIMEALLAADGIRVGTFTSPHVLVYNERIRINAENASDADICHAFEVIERLRDNISLTYFEFSALAALWLFAKHELDVVLLEVGLGGRLDAVNIIDPDVAVITSIELDHQEWLGTSRSAIALEKCGIARTGLPLVCAEQNPPQDLLDYINRLGAHLFLLGQDGFYCRERLFESQSVDNSLEKKLTLTLECLDIDGEVQTFEGLPKPYLPLPSAVCALQALILIGHEPAFELLARVFSEARLPGRFQQFDYCGRRIILDVAHNPAAAKALAIRLDSLDSQRIHCIFGALVNKDIVGMIEPVLSKISHWYLCGLPDSPFSASAEQMKELVYNCVQACGDGVGHGLRKDLSDWSVQCYDSPREAFYSAFDVSDVDEIILVFGSFLTVAGALEYCIESRA